MKKKIFAVALAATMALSSVMTAFGALSGDLEVTDFFKEKSEFTELKSGDSLKFTFNNKSKGTNNYENYVMAIVGADAATFKGADQEILIFRADNWGWGGKMSDFVAPDAKEGNKLVFENNIGEDFAPWATLMQAGTDVEIIITRDGNTLEYKATMGKYKISTKATSGIALPETCYVFFTGEKVSLTNFAVTDATAATEAPAGDTTATTATTAAGTTAGTGTPETSDVATTSIIILAAVAAIAVVVLKKKEVTE